MFWSQEIRIFLWEADRGGEVRRGEAKASHKGKKQLKSKALQNAAAFSRQTQMIGYAEFLMISECKYLICFHG